MEQVYVRKQNLFGNTATLVQAEVVSKSGDTLKVKLVNSRNVIEVKAQDTVPCSSLYGGQPRINSHAAQRRILKQYPSSNSALGNR